MLSLFLIRQRYALLPLAALLITCRPTTAVSVSQSPSLTPTQAAIEKQRQRLAATDPEERRDALMQLGAMHRSEASRAATTGLSDSSPMVRAVAAKAILSLGPDESVVALTPLLADKNEFVRREVAYALGLTKSSKATDGLTQVLLNDKEDGVRAAAAVALGDVGDESAVVTLANILSGDANSSSKRGKTEKNGFVLRAVAKSLGQIKSRAAVPALITALANEKLVEDVRREAARALGMIGDPAAVPALRIAAASGDPYLAQAAFESLRKLNP
jgi:HEAT repeat protein